MQKTNKKTWLAGTLSVLMMLTVILGIFFVSPLTASAATNRSGVYMLYGTYTDGDGTHSGYMDKFAIQVGTQYFYDDGSTTKHYQDRTYNWTYFSFFSHADGIKEHKSFSLTRNGNTYYSRTLSGKDKMYLYQGQLPDGNYVLTYKGVYGTTLWFTEDYTFTYRFSVDTTSPSYTLKAGGYNVASGSYANQAITYSITDTNPYRVYYLSPSASSYTYTSATSKSVSATSANNGWWYFYSIDSLSNSNSVVSVYLDTVAPTGTVKNASGVTVSNGGYTNSAVKYTATDAGGVSYCQVKLPGSSTWTSYTAGTALSSSYGWYTFRSVDKAGNTSAEYKVYYDAGIPSGTLYGGTTSKPSGSYTNADYVKYTASDSYSGIANCYVMMPNSSYYTAYASGTQLATEGTYYFYSVDKSGNMSSTVSIVLDKTKPKGTLYGGTSVISSGTSTNASYIKFVPSDNILLKNTYVKRPGSSTYTAYTSGTQYTAEGVYSFYSVDNAGNTSDTYTVTLDRQIPTAQLYVDGNPVGNNSYTKGEHISFVCGEKSYVKLPGSDSFTEYLSGAEYYKPGKYVFYGISDAGNSTGYYTVVIDRTQKIVSFQNVTEGSDKGDVMIHWTDGDSNLYAPITSVTVNGKPCANGTIVYTIDTGVYHVDVVDAAGNTWSTFFTSEKKNIVTDTLQKEYYEIHDANGDIYSFATYENALAFAKERENTYVRTGEWNSASWDTGMAMDGKDSVNAENGTYYIYKKSGNPSEEVAYFTLDRLNEVITEYAEIGIESYYYWEKAPAAAADGENLFTYSESKNILASSVTVGDHIGTLLDGEAFVGTVIETEGFHTLTVFDEYGNTCDYYLAIIRTAPEIKYALGEGGTNTATFDRTYYFRDQVTVSIADPYDEMAMFSVFDENGDLIGIFNLGETHALTESGTYTVEAMNHAGKSMTFALTVSRHAPEAVFTENADKKQLTLTVTESQDDKSHIQTLEIFKSTDGGETWALAEKDDYGTDISLETLSYKFRTTGIYKAILTDEFRTGIDAVTVQYDYVQPIPDGKLTGVNDGGHTNGKVTFAWTDEATVTLKKDGMETAYASGDELTEDGEYVLTFENFDGYRKVYTFTVDTAAPEIDLTGAENYGTVSEDVTVVYYEDDLTTEITRNGVSLGAYTSGTTLTEEGSYVITLCDRAGNKTEAAFTIDKTVDFSVNVNDGGLSNSVTATAIENVTVNLTKNGEAVAYTLGEAISNPADYVLTLTDEIGNGATVSFRIVNPLVKHFSHNFDDVNGFEGVTVNGEDKRLNYGTLEITEDGIYEVGVTVSGKTYSFTVTVDKTAPSLILDSVENGSVTNTDVILSAVSEQAELTVTKNGQSIAYAFGDRITEDGKYTVTLTDTCGNASAYSFTIDKTVDYTVNIYDGGLSNSVTATANENVTVNLTKNGEAVAYTLRDIITDPADYVLTLTDEIGNSETVSFRIVEPLVQNFSHSFEDVDGITVNGNEAQLTDGKLELTADGEYEIGVTVNGNVLYSFKVTVDGTAPSVTIDGVEIGGTTKDSVTISSVSEQAALVLTQDGVAVEYKLGDVITEPGEYTVSVIDACGNCGVYTFTIEKGVNGGLIALIAILSATGLGGTAAVIVKKKQSE